MKHYTIPVFIPELACPFQCIFCNQKKITDTLRIPSQQEIMNIFDTHLSSIDWKNSHVEIGFFGGNFTGIDISEQKRLLKCSEIYLNSGMVRSVRVSTRPDYIDMERLKLLADFGVKTIELGAQSMCDDVLTASGRGHKAADTERASGMILGTGFSLGLQMMVGLPADDNEKSIFTARRIIGLGASCTRIYPALVIRDTKMEEMYYKGKYKPLTLEEAVKRTKHVYKLFEENNVQIIRVGLHPSEGLLDGSAYIAGPFHISFRELVLSDIWRDVFMAMDKDTAPGRRRIILHVPEGQINYAAGYKASNKNYLLEFFSEVKFRTDSSLKGREYYADYC